MKQEQTGKKYLGSASSVKFQGRMLKIGMDKPHTAGEQSPRPQKRWISFNKTSGEFPADHSELEASPF